MRKILVIQTAFIGDVILTTPFLQALLSKWPNTEIHFVGVKAGCEMLEGLPQVHLHVLDKKNRFAGLKSLFTELNAHEFDVVFSVHRSLRSLWIGRKVKAKKRIGFDSILSRALGYEGVQYPDYSEDVHYADKPMALFAPFGEVPKTPRPRLAVYEKDAQKLPVLPKNYFVLSPFSVWGTKAWLPERFAEAAIRLAANNGLAVVITGGGSGADEKDAQEITRIIHDSGERVYNLVGKTGFNELKALIKNARLVLSNDSAAVHIAAAFDRPVTAIFGPTVKKWGFFPLSTKFRVVERHDVPCRPCSLHGPMVCPQKHFRCMKEISVLDVVKAAEALL